MTFNTNFRQLSLTILTIVIALAIVTNGRMAMAVDYSWANPASGSFLSPGSWNPAGVPGVGDTATFNLGSTGYTVSLPNGSGTVPVTTIFVSNDTVTLDPGQSTLSAGFKLGNNTGDVANLTLVDGTLLGPLTVGNAAGTTGTVTVDGNLAPAAVQGNSLVIGLSGNGKTVFENGSTANIAADLGFNSTSTGELDVLGTNPFSHAPTSFTGNILSGSGTATVLVNVGATASIPQLSLGTNAGSTSVATFDGAGTTATITNSLSLGSVGNGTLNVTNGAQVTVNSSSGLVLTSNSGSQALIDVAGTGSSLALNIPSITSGAGSATLQASGGASVTGGGNIILANVGSGTANVTLSGAGTTWSGVGSINVGEFGTGTALVQSGAQMSVVATTSLGGGSTSNSQLTVTGAGSQWNTGSLSTGAQGSATVSVKNGGALNITGAATMASNPGSAAAVTLDGAGSTWTSGSLAASNLGTSTWNVTGGAQGTVTGDMRATGTTNLTVNGAGSKWSAGSMTLGGATTLTVESGGNLTAGSIRFDGFGNTTNNSLTVTGAGSKLNVTTGGLSISSPSPGAVNVNQGAAVSITGGALVGGDSAPGVVNVDGAGTSWQSDSLNVGVNGLGMMSVTNGAKVSAGSLGLGTNSQTVTGTLDITGTGSQLSVTGATNIGLGGGASLNVTGGATTSAGGLTRIGQQNTGQATLTIDGVGSKWTDSGSIQVGVGGNGNLFVTGGAALSSSKTGTNTGYSGVVGANSSGGGQVTISGAGSTWSQDGTLVVGDNGRGSATFQAGGTVTSAAGIVGFQGSVQNVVTVTDPGSSWTMPGALNVGGVLGVGASGEVNIENGATVSSGSGTIGSGASGAVLVTGADSAWNVAGSVSMVGSAILSVGTGGLVQIGNSLNIMGPSEGLVNLTGGGSVIVGAASGSSAQSNIQPAGASVPPGTLDIGTGGSLVGMAHIVGSLLNANGSIGPGSLTINNDFTQQAGGQLTLNLLGENIYAPGGVSGDELFVSGNAALSGQLHLDFQDPSQFVIKVGQTYDLMQVGGNFSATGLSLSFTGVDPGFGYTTQFFDGIYSLTVTRVPEPSTLLLASCGALAFVARRLRRPTRASGRGLIARIFVSKSDQCLATGWSLGSTDKSSRAPSPRPSPARGEGVLLGLFSAVLVLVCLVAVRTAHGADYYWKAPVSGDYYDPTKYTPSPGPTDVSDVERFNLGSAGYTITAAQNVGGVIPLGGTDVDNDTLTFSGIALLTPVDLGNNPGDVANLTLLKSRINASVGNVAGSTGVLTVDGSQGISVVSGVAVGYGGNGTLNVINGGQVSTTIGTYIGYQPGSTGTATVDGSKSIWSSGPLYVGYGGVGSLTLQNGATSSIGGASPNSLFVGYQAGSQGTFNLTDASLNVVGSTSMAIGYGGTGMMTIGDGATANVSGGVTIGGSGTGSLSITGSGSLVLGNTNQTIVLGDQANSQGTFNVVGPSASFTTANGTGQLVVGNSGAGSFSVTGGAQITVPACMVGKSTGGTGLITIDGAGTSLAVSYPQPLSLGGPNSVSSTVLVKDGASLSAGVVNVGAGGGQNTLTFDGAGTTGNFLNNAGFTVPQGTLNIQNGATVNVSQQGGNEVYIGASPNVYSGTLNGAAHVDGANSSWNIDGKFSVLSVGDINGHGSLTISGGATVNVGLVTPGVTQGTVFNGSTSSIDIQQGTLNAATVVNNGTLRVDGTLNAGVNSSAGSLISGSGTINGTIGLSGTVAPGDSPGTLSAQAITMSAGSGYRLEINSAGGTAGSTVGWSLLSLSGSAELLGVSHTISLESLTNTDMPGQLADFDPTHNYHWTFLTTGGVVFDPAGFKIDTSGFDNPIYGQFGVTATQNALTLNYTAPEPSSLVLAACCAVLPAILRLRRGVKIIGWGLRVKGDRH